MTVAVTRALPVRSDPPRPGSTPFGRMLTHFRERAGIKQAALADRTWLSHATISRLQSGERNPERETVQKLANALNLNAGDTDALMASAGFAPNDITNLLADEIVIGEVLTLLRDERVSDERKDALRQQLTLTVRMARMTG